jgi:hypothetical protein
MDEPRDGLDIVIKENITASVKTKMFLLFSSHHENSSPLSHGKAMLVQGYIHILTPSKYLTLYQFTFYEVIMFLENTTFVQYLL